MNIERSRRLTDGENVETLELLIRGRRQPYEDLHEDEENEFLILTSKFSSTFDTSHSSSIVQSTFDQLVATYVSMTFLEEINSLN
jgi:hypothetical protein